MVSLNPLSVYRRPCLTNEAEMLITVLFRLLYFFVVLSDVKLHLTEFKTTKSSNDKLAVRKRSSRERYPSDGQHRTRYHGTKNVSLF